MEILAEKNTQQTFYFPLIDAGATDFESTPVSFVGADVQYSIDGAAFGNTTNSPSHEGNGIYSLVLTAAELNGTRIVVTVIDAATKAWEDQALIITTTLGGFITTNRTIYVLSCDNGTFTPTDVAAEFTMVAPTEVEEATADHFVGRLLTGAGASDASQAEQTGISDSELANSKVKLTYDQLTAAPANGSIWVIH